jgi:hypothetical protein
MDRQIQEGILEQGCLLQVDRKFRCLDKQNQALVGSWHQHSAQEELGLEAHLLQGRQIQLDRPQSVSVLPGNRSGCSDQAPSRIVSA